MHLHRRAWFGAVAAEFADYRDEPDLDDGVRAFAADLAAASGDRPIAFLERLNETLFERTDRYIRGSGHMCPDRRRAFGARLQGLS